jgi:pyruvate-formate lyase-activating enzyme
LRAVRCPADRPRFMRSGVLPARVLHVHPTRACNLSCAHCYSSSSPDIRSSLDVALLSDALRGFRAEGFEVLSLSGGEPLVYRDLGRLVRAATECGYRVHLVTNGLLLTRERLAALRGHVHLVAVSFDGAERTHNQVRGRPDAFAKANKALDVLGSSDVSFALAFGVSRWSLPDVPWAFERAREVGASVLHLRPLVAEGRGTGLDDWMLGAADCARLALVADLLDRGPVATPRVQVDLVAVQEILTARTQFDVLRPGRGIKTLSDAVNPLVIDELGRCLAFTYGIHPRFAIASLTHDWRQEVAHFKSDSIWSIVGLLNAAFASAGKDGSEYLDWFAHLTRLSHEIGSALASTPRISERQGGEALRASRWRSIAGEDRSERQDLAL